MNAIYVEKVFALAISVHHFARNIYYFLYHNIQFVYVLVISQYEYDILVIIRV